MNLIKIVDSGKLEYDGTTLTIEFSDDIPSLWQKIFYSYDIGGNSQYYPLRNLDGKEVHSVTMLDSMAGAFHCKDFQFYGNKATRQFRSFDHAKRACNFTNETFKVFAESASWYYRSATVVARQQEELRQRQEAERRAEIDRLNKDVNN